MASFPRELTPGNKQSCACKPSEQLTLAVSHGICAGNVCSGVLRAVHTGCCSTNVVFVRACSEQAHTGKHKRQISKRHLVTRRYSSSKQALWSLKFFTGTYQSGRLRCRCTLVKPGSLPGFYQHQVPWLWCRKGRPATQHAQTTVTLSRRGSARAGHFQVPDAEAVWPQKASTQHMLLLSATAEHNGFGLCVYLQLGVAHAASAYFACFVVVAGWCTAGRQAGT